MPRIVIFLKFIYKTKKKTGDGPFIFTTSVYYFCHKSKKKKYTDAIQMLNFVVSGGSLNHFCSKCFFFLVWQFFCIYCEIIFKIILIGMRYHNNWFRREHSQRNILLFHNNVTFLINFHNFSPRNIYIHTIIHQGNILGKIWHTSMIIIYFKFIHRK